MNIANNNDQIGDLMDGFSSAPKVKRSRLAEATQRTNADIDITPEQREQLAKNRNEHRGRTPQGGPRVAEYKNKTFRISKASDETLAKIAAVSGKPYKELLDEAVCFLSKKYNL